MAEYTPSDDEVRTAWHQYATATDAEYARLREDDDHPTHEFDRFLARVRRDAWNEGVEAFEVAHKIDNIDPWAHLRDNPYPEETPCTCDSAPPEIGGAQHRAGCGEEPS